MQHHYAAATQEDRPVTAQLDPTRMSQSVLDEERLLVERARREAEAFGQLYSRYYPRVYAYVYTRTQSPESAEDITADTFVLAMENIGRYEWRNVPFSAWLFRIASSQVATHFRRSRPCAQLDETLVHEGAGPEDEAIRRSDAEEVCRALTLLKSDQQKAVTLRYRHEMRNGEIAATMGRTEASVKLLVHRGMAALRATMLPLSA